MLFQVSFIVTIVLRLLLKYDILAESIAVLVLPFLTIYLLKKIFIRSLCHCLFLRNQSRITSKKRVLIIKNRNLYFVLNHFNFFFDCFLGSFVCIARMFKSTSAALIFMPRLDNSIHGRYLEQTDLGFVSYASFIHMEVNQTHPVKIAFCELLFLQQSDSVSRRIRYDESELKRERIKRKWRLVCILEKYPSLVKLRKQRVCNVNANQHVEDLKQFVSRGYRAVLRSNSTPQPLLNNVTT